MSYQHILVALGGNHNEKQIIKEAFQLAHKLEASLHFLHVNHPGVGKPHMMMDAPEAIDKEDIKNQIREAGYSQEADKVDIKIEEDDDYPERIAKATRKADLVVIGHSQRNQFLQALINSVDEQVANISDCPVLIVPKS